MRPLQDLLHRIRWDSNFGKGRFALGYWDRVAREERTVPFASVSFEPDRPGFFSLKDEDGAVRQVPLHRVRTVYRDGAIIWRRARPAGHR